MSHPKKSCAFCGRSAPEVKMSKEHVLRAKLAKFDTGGTTHMDFEQKYRPLDPEGELFARSLNIPKRHFDQTVNDVCKPCNEGWLVDDVEDPAERWIVGAMQGRRFASLTAEAARALALWGAKTAAVRALVDPGHRAIPKEHYAHIMTRLEPPPNTSVWLAHVDSRGIPFTRHARYGLWRDTELVNAHLTSILLGDMAIYVLGAGDDLYWSHQENTVAAFDHHDVRQLWPVCHVGPWPANRLPFETARALTGFKMAEGDEHLWKEFELAAI